MWFCCCGLGVLGFCLIEVVGCFCKVFEVGECVCVLGFESECCVEVVLCFVVGVEFGL